MEVDVLFRHQALKRRAQTEAIAQVCLSGELKIRWITKTAQVTGKLICQATDGGRV